ncbi:mechanosensitive ion channel [Citricoccus nitrophenolicus]|uniref:mechanosensitive ion channel n=1 Tax=Citricoccus nitrophenolicus TaxID=863575 RepID=UPI0031E68A31
MATRRADISVDKDGNEELIMDALANYDWIALLEKVVMAIVILLVTWLLAKLVKMGVTRLVDRLARNKDQGGGQDLAEGLGKIASLVIWLFGLMAVLQVFALQQVLTPVQNLLDGFLGALPGILGAGVILFVGLILARVARDLVRTVLETAGFDRGVARMTRGKLGGEPAPGQEASQPSSILATLVYVITVIVVVIAALQVLGIPAIAQPAQDMLQSVLDVLPAIILGLVLLGVGWFIGGLVYSLLQPTLAGTAMDRVAAERGILPEGQRASNIVARIVQAVIVLSFAVMATRVLGFPEINQFLGEVIALGSRILFGVAFIVAGVVLAGLLRSTLGRDTAGQVVYWATIALFAAMGLSYMGIAESIVNLAFGAVVVGGALAAALAFGLGGREAAARRLARAEQSAPVTPQPGTGAHAGTAGGPPSGGPGNTSAAGGPMAGGTGPGAI